MDKSNEELTNVQQLKSLDSISCLFQDIEGIDLRPRNLKARSESEEQLQKLPEILRNHKCSSKDIKNEKIPKSQESIDSDASQIIKSLESLLSSQADDLSLSLQKNGSTHIFMEQLQQLSNIVAETHSQLQSERIRVEALERMLIVCSLELGLKFLGILIKVCAC